jgi:hypothetical protein
MKRFLKLFGLITVLLAARATFADCGSIPFKPWVSVYEPNQRAVIAFNGKEQILILSTDLRASEPTKVLEVLPLPSEPELKAGSVDVFYRTTEFINRKLFPRKSIRGVGGGFGGAGGGGGAANVTVPPPAGEVTKREKIGAHDISVTHVLDGERFVQWAQKYLLDQGVDQAKIPDGLKAVVEDYIADGYKWFAFDVVDLKTNVVTKDAIQYRFKTRWLYYPLRITRAEKGETNVKLLVFTPRLVELPSGPDLTVRLVHRPIDVRRNELLTLDPDLHNLLRSRYVKLRTWETQGQLSEFKSDILTR